MEMFARMYVRTDVQIPPVFYRTSSPLGPLPKNRKKPVAQRQDMVSGTLALIDSLSEAAFYMSRASAPKGDEVL